VLLGSLVHAVARMPTSIHAKLVMAFLAMVALLITLGAVGLQVLSASNSRAEELVLLQRKIAAYRQLQNDTTEQLYSVASALLAPDEATLEATLRQLSQFGYDFDRLQYVARDETELLALVRQDYAQFSEISNRVVDLIRSGHVAESQELQRSQSRPLADRLERRINQLVNKAEADIVAKIGQNEEAYLANRWLVIGFAVGSIILALLLGYTISWTIVEPVRRMDARLRRIAEGDFTEHVAVPNRDELGTLAANLNRMNDELDQVYQQLTAASQHKSEFLASMSHELRTPLNAIIGFSEVLIERMFGDLNERQDEYLHDIFTSGRHLLSLINDILDLSKIEAGHMELELATFSLREALENGLTMVRERASNHGIEIGLEIDPALDDIEADERKVKQVVFNLLSNAVKFTPDGGQIDISARIVDGVVQVALRDTGVGIAPEEQSLIFEEFRQAGLSSSQKHEGTGLGLALCKRFVELHGGRIWVESEPGVGSTFTFVLPNALAVPTTEPATGDAVLDLTYADQPSMVPAHAGPNGLAPTMPGPSSLGPTILVIEDNAASIELLTLHIRGAGFQVAVARDGAEGLDLAHRIRPSGIVLDLMLPRVDGWDVLARVKADPDLWETPIVVVSMLDERGRGFALGAADYLLKPIDAATLLGTLRRVIRSVDDSDNESLTLLAVDDDPLAIELLRTSLVPAGFTVLTAGGGAEGLETARLARPDLIILDLMMPDVDGFAVVEALRDDPGTAAIPIVVLTSKSMTSDEKARLNGRISHLARKGDFDRTELLALIRTLCPAAA
jgi:signal transduction histidine kinase/CheY-like chemotaxis protein